VPKRMKPGRSIVFVDAVAYAFRSRVRNVWFCSSSRDTPLFTRQMVELDSRFATVTLGTSRPLSAPQPHHEPPQSRQRQPASANIVSIVSAR
jgi:hypothetical protein